MSKRTDRAGQADVAHGTTRVCWRIVLGTDARVVDRETRRARSSLQAGISPSVTLCAAVLGLAAGGLFVLEAVSVIVQVVSFKLTGKRVFKMAPIHHHYEQMGWTEPQIVIRFWIVAIVLAMLGLATLKLR